MPNTDIPRLCGGTFFLQLLRMKKPPTRSRADGLMGERDLVNNQRILEALIRMFKPDFMVYADSTFKGDVSDYRACKAAVGDNLPFDETRADFSKFDEIIRHDYQHALPVMHMFVKKYIKTEEPSLVISSVKAMLQTVADDKTIQPTDKFYMGEMGLPLTKAKLTSTDCIILEPFLLGLWHFIVMNRPDNLIGRATFCAWNKKQPGENKPWRYVSGIGGDYPDVAIRLLDGTVIQDAGFFAKNEDVYEELDEDEESYASSAEADPIFSEYRQLFLQQNFLFNNGKFFIQNAAKIYNIEHVDHLD